MEKSAQSLVEAQRTFFNSGATRPIAFRRAMLKKLKSAILSREKDILDAVHRDLGKSDFEAFTTEIVLVLREIDTMLKNLGKWTKPRRRSAGLFNFPGRARVYHDPHGVCLVMSPWNYPFQLTIMPLVGAIAGGNTVIVKPSAYSPATQDCIADMITETFDPSYITVVTGGRDANQNLLEQKFDYIFFTGGIQVGSLVMTQAAKHLTPVTLELGGKSPCIIAPDADIDRAAKRAAWGKCINAGQTCVAPDHFLVHRSVRDVFVEKMRSYIEKFYGIEPHTNPEFPNIINKKHFERLSALITSAQRMEQRSFPADEPYRKPSKLSRPFLPVLPARIRSCRKNSSVRLFQFLNGSRKTTLLPRFLPNRARSPCMCLPVTARSAAASCASFPSGAVASTTP